MRSVQARAARLLPYALFFLSGAAGLSYELVWTRLLGRYFGHTVHAVTTVLAAFMAGLALGSVLLGARADRTRHPLRLYGWLEIGIGVACLLAPWLLELARSVYVALYPSLGEGVALRTLLQFALALLVLIVPATLMGGTLPALVRAVSTPADRTAGHVALLYAVNTAGAAVGALAAGYWLLPQLGIAAANQIGVAINLAIGGVVWLISRGRAAPEPAGPAASVTRGTTDRVLAASLFVSGAVAMTYQIAWTRSLILVIGSSTYAFTAILVTFLLGLATGSYVQRSLPRGNTPGFFALLQVAVALAAFLLMPLFDQLPALFLRLFADYDGGFSRVLLTQFAIVTPFVFVPALFLGMVFPAAVGILSRDPARAGHDVGRLYAYNTLGAIAGSVAAGFLLIPWLGAQRTLALAIATNLLLGAAVLQLAGTGRRLGRVAALLVVALAMPWLPAWDRVRMSAGVSIYPRGYVARAQGGPLSDAPFEVLFFREGISTTVSVTTTPQGGKSLRVNGKVDASTEPVDMLTQARLAYIPLLLHPAPRRVAIIGLGSGVTAGVAALGPSVEHVDVIELEPAVVEAAALFGEHNFGVLQQRKVALHIDDARGFMEVARGSYDVVISEPSNPWIAGVASLFSAEFMTLVEQRLARHGIFCQWLQTYSIAPAELRLVLRTFLAVFEDASLWRASPTDYLLLGRKRGSDRIGAEGVSERLQAMPRLSQLIEAHGEHPIESVWTSFLLGGEELRAYAGKGPLHTEDLLHLEFQAPRSLYADHGTDIDRELLSRRTRAFPGFVDVSAGDRAAAPFYLGQYLLLRQRPRDAAWFLQQVRPLAPFASPAPHAPVPLWEPLPAPVTRVHEDFEAAPRLGLIPRVVWHGDQAAAGHDDPVALRAAYELLFSRVSGIAGGSGVDGSTGLILRWVPDASFVGFVVPQIVEPATRYRVSWSMRNGPLAGEYAAVAVEQFDAVEATGAQLLPEFVAAHSVEREIKVRIDAAQDWTRHAFELSTHPRARMAQIILFRAGKPGTEPVLFDEISVEELGPVGM